MPPIPHGHTAPERRQYATTIKGLAAAYYDDMGQWVRVPQNFHPNVVLVEVWARHGDVDVHPSRNRFFPVSDDEQQVMWHKLATNPNIMSTLQSGHSAQAVRGKGSHPQSSHPKPLEAQFSWAMQDKVIGYTSPQEILDPDLDSVITKLGKIMQGVKEKAAIPSVYYSFGHATLDHPKLGNMGWDDRKGWQCLFFGNVPTHHVY